MNRIGLYYNFGSQWVAGSYYIQNIIRALASLDPSEQPHLISKVGVRWLKTASQLENMFCCPISRFIESKFRIMFAFLIRGHPRI